MVLLQFGKVAALRCLAEGMHTFGCTTAVRREGWCRLLVSRGTQLSSRACGAYSGYCRNIAYNYNRVTPPLPTTVRQLCNTPSATPVNATLDVLPFIGS